MLNRLEVHHVISDGVTNIHHFNLLFGILDIPSELARKVKSSPSRLRVFPSAEEAVNETFFGDRLDRFCSLFESSRQGAHELLKAGRFPFNGDSSMVTFFLRVDPPEDNNVACIGGEVDYSLGGGAHKPKQRNRETKMVLSIVEQASVFVWPRDQNGIPLPTNKPRASSGGGTSSTNYKTKPAWVEHHLVVILNSLAAQSGIKLESSMDSLRAKAVRLVNGWRQDMLANGSEKEDHADRFALWKASPYGKLWLNGDYRAPIRPFSPCLARCGSSKASTEIDRHE